MPSLSDRQDTSSITVAVQLGNAVSIMMGTKRYLSFRIAALAAWLLPAVRIKQFKAYFDDKGRPVGYVTWAFLSDETQQRWQCDPDMILHHSEWNEGLNLWIIDFASPYGFTRAIMTDLRDNLFEGHKEIHWTRPRDNNVVRAPVVWRRRS